MVTKSLTGQEYELDLDILRKEEIDKHKPAQIIYAMQVLGIGSVIKLNEKHIIDDNQFIFDGFFGSGAVVTRVIDYGDEVIIEAEEKIPKKSKYVLDILENLDFKQGLANERFIEILTNIFTQEQLKEILACDDIEILPFHNLMFLKVNNKAYRL